MGRAGMVTDPGTLDVSLRIEHIVERRPDGAGGYDELWGPLEDGEHVWASLEPLRGQERLRAMQQRSNATHTITIRWRDDVTSLCRVIPNDLEWSIYQIVEPPRDLPDHRRTHLRFFVREEPREVIP